MKSTSNYTTVVELYGSYKKLNFNNLHSIRERMRDR